MYNTMALFFLNNFIKNYHSNSDISIADRNLTNFDKFIEEIIFVLLMLRLVIRIFSNNYKIKN